MAFRQPRLRPQPARHLSHPAEAPQSPSPAKQRTVEESQNWILFTPQPDELSISQISHTPCTATHLSDCGSLETHVRSQPRPESLQDDPALINQGSEDDGADLDSLDDGLHAFHSPFSISGRLDQSGGAVLPTHDGFGTFLPSSAALQAHLWQFERHNPHRQNKNARRRSSVQRRLDALEEEDHIDPDDEKTARIERWRLDQSMAVLEEVERETRRRRRRVSRMTVAPRGLDRRQSLHDALASRILTRQGLVPSGPGTSSADEQPPSDSFWRRITRKVIQDLIGLDDSTLSVIFGEQLADDASSTPTPSSPVAASAQQEPLLAFRDSASSWEAKILDRIARELGILVHQLSDYDGTAFDSYQQAQQAQIEYACLPCNIIRQPSMRQRRRAEKARVEHNPSEALFSPTLPSTPFSSDQPDTSLWGIEEEEEEEEAEEAVDDAEEEENRRQEQEYWEQNVNVKMIFSYLKSRFASKVETPDRADAEMKANGPLPASWATNTGASAFSTPPDGLRRAEIAQRQHPLVFRAARASTAQSRRRDSLLRRYQIQTLMQRRPGSSSCASHSATKRSRHSRSASSRHYWLEGSHGSAPPVFSGLGGWGDV